MRTILLALIMSSGLLLAEERILHDRSRVVFLGDSNTYSGRFIAYLEAHARVHDPDRMIEWINLGLPSETISGLSEADHPYPRPNIHSRLANALARAKPTLVVVSYGMNDGIYSPFSEERLRAYQDGYRQLIADCEKAGTRVVLMTPAPFDVRPIREKAVPAGAEKYSWQKPYAAYDSEVLSRYSAWLRTYRDKRYPVADAHTAIHDHLQRMRKELPDYFVSGDGIHPDANGHYVIFRELASTLGLPILGKEATVDVASGQSGSEGIGNIRVGLGKVEFDWKVSVVFPRDRNWHPRLAELEKVGSGIGSFRLSIKGLPPGNHELHEGDRKLGEWTAEAWNTGVDLGSLKELSINIRSQEFWELIQKKQLVTGHAWLTDVGHRRPDTRKGIPLPEALEFARKTNLELKELQTAGPLRLRVQAAK